MPQSTAKAKKPKPSLYKRAWDTFSRIDVGDHIDTKQNFSYLSWPWAWTQLMNHFPESTFSYWEQDHEDGTVMVCVTVTVREGKEEARRHMWLPCMDNRNNAIVKPDTRQISDSRMRTLVKTLALFGLGLDLYAGSDLPVGSVDDQIGDSQLELLAGLYEKLDEATRSAYLGWLGVESLKQISQGKYKAARLQLERKVKMIKKPKK